MTTSAQIQAAIDEASSVIISPAQMVQLIDRAIAAAFATSAGSAELPSVTYTIGGRSRTLAMAEARELRTYYAGIAGGGVQFVSIEFGP